MYNIAIVGASGAVGQEMIKILEKRNFPVSSIKFLASKRSAGKKVIFKNEEFLLEELSENSFSNVNFALFSAGSAVSKKYAHYAVKNGAIVIDNSSCFRMEKEVPLVVPEVNPKTVAKHKGIIANPNCTTIILLLALKPLADLYALKNVYVSTYQSASGAGATGVAELLEQIKNFKRADLSLKSQYFSHQLLNNLIPQIGDFKDDNYTEEELKMLNESRKILDLPDLSVSATCIRVPVLTAHSESVVAEFSEDTIIDFKEVKEALTKAPGLDFLDNQEEKIYPMPKTASGLNNCQVGRLRMVKGKTNALTFWICGDQLRKGAALNAIQIMELLSLGMFRD